jgi:diamine N-acetyltransferase
MSHDLVVRIASPADYEQACVLLDRLDELHRQRLPWLFRTPETQPRSRSYFEQLLIAGDSSILVADAGGVVGVAIVLIRSAPQFPVFIPQRWGVLDAVVVSPSCRRRGVGRQLALAAETWATAQGAAWVELGVYEFNSDARRFYEALGYLPVSSKLRKETLPSDGS